MATFAELEREVHAIQPLMAPGASGWLGNLTHWLKSAQRWDTVTALQYGRAIFSVIISTLRRLPDRQKRLQHWVDLIGRFKVAPKVQQLVPTADEQAEHTFQQEALAMISDLHTLLELFISFLHLSRQWRAYKPEPVFRWGQFESLEQAQNDADQIDREFGLITIHIVKEWTRVEETLKDVLLAELHRLGGGGRDANERHLQRKQEVADFSVRVIKEADQMGKIDAERLLKLLVSCERFQPHFHLIPQVSVFRTRELEKAAKDILKKFIEVGHRNESSLACLERGETSASAAGPNP